MKPCDVSFRIDNAWYDVSSWMKYHPGGEEILKHFHGEDATDVFYSIHSKEAISRLQQMKIARSDDTERTLLQKNFEKLVKKLEDEKWFDHNPLIDILLLSIVLFLLIGGILVSNYSSILAMIMIGLSMQQAGWLSHSYTHSRAPTALCTGKIISCLINGISPSWWKNKHTAHHAMPNHTDVDPDIQLSPSMYTNVFY